MKGRRGSSEEGAVEGFFVEELRLNAALELIKRLEIKKKNVVSRCEIF